MLASLRQVVPAGFGGGSSGDSHASLSDGIELELSEVATAGGKDVPAAAVATGAAASSDPSSAADGAPKLSRRKQFFSVSGMTCAACSGTIERALQRVRGVHSARVSLLTERCEVVFDERILSAAQVVSEIEDVGFEASVSPAASKGKISLLTSENMSDDKRAVITRAVLEQTGVLNVRIEPRNAPPHHDVLEVEFETDRHALTGPGGAKPVVAQGAISASAAARAAENLGRFSVRELVEVLGTQYNLPIAMVRNDGDLEARKAEMRLRRQNELRHWKRAFLSSLLFTVPIAVLCWLAPLSPSWSAWVMQPLHRALSREAFLMWVLVTPVQFGFGARFYRAGWLSLKHGSANMDVLVALGSSAAYFYSLLICILCLSNDHYEGNVFFETSALLISIVLLGRYVEHVAKGRTSEALSVLMSLQAATALLITVDPSAANPGSASVLKEEEVDVNLVQRDDLLLVHRGAKIPCDGVVESEEPSAVDESLLTGESMPVSKKKGDTVIGGTLNLDAPLRVRARGVGSDTVLFKIVEMVQDAQSSKAPIQAYADFVGAVFVPVVVVLALITFVVWYAACHAGVVPLEWLGEHQSPFLFSFLFAISVLLISCPCSLGLATPTAVMVGTGVGAALGVLFKGGEPLELTGEADVVVFDKTGTLTVGKPSVQRNSTAVLRLDSLGLQGGEKEWWALVGALAHESEHLMSRAIAAYARQMQQDSPLSPVPSAAAAAAAASVVFDPVAHFEAESGAGCRGEVRGHKVLIGNARWLASQGVLLSGEEQAQMEAVQTGGNVAVLVAMDGVLTGIVSLADSVKSEAACVVRALQARGIEVFMLTGDNARSAQAVGSLVGLDSEHVIAQVTPKDKADVVKRIQHIGRKAKPEVALRDRTADERPLRVEPGLLKASLLHRSSGGGLAEASERVAAMLSTPRKMSEDAAALAHDDDMALLEEGGLRAASSSSSSVGADEDGYARVRSPTAITVLMVGDGVNDSGSLAVADVGVAIGSGSDLAVETAQVVLMRSDLTDVITAIDLSQATLRRIRRNFTWACIYNVLSIPIAAGALYPLLHVGLPPLLAAACMGLSSVSVIASSLWLKRYKKPVLVDDDGPGGATHFGAKELREGKGAVIVKASAAAQVGGSGARGTMSPSVLLSSASRVSGGLGKKKVVRSSGSRGSYAFSSLPTGPDGVDEEEEGELPDEREAEAQARSATVPAAGARFVVDDDEEYEEQAQKQPPPPQPQAQQSSPFSPEESLTPQSPHSAEMSQRRSSTAAPEEPAASDAADAQHQQQQQHARRGQRLQPPIKGPARR